MITPDEQPRVRIELDADRALLTPTPVARQRPPLGPVVMMALVLLIAIVGLSRLSGDDAVTPDPLQGETQPEPTGADPSGDEDTRAVISAALAAQIDTYDRITYTSISPALTSIVRNGDEWVTIDDQGLVAHSPNLLSWVPILELRDQRGLAISSSPDGPKALTQTSTHVQIIDVQTRDIDALHPIRGEVLFGSLAPDGRWGVVVRRAEGWSLTTGDSAGSIQTFPLGDTRPTSVAVTADQVLMTTEDDETSAVMIAPRAALTSKAGPESSLLVCALQVRGGRLHTNGDGDVQLVEEQRAWELSADGDRLELVVDATLVPSSSRLDVRPIATGEGWSVASSSDPDADPAVWITRDGLLYERQRIPTGRGRPGHVIWAYLGGSEGVGVRVSDTAAERGLLRIGDVRARHPRPQELSRNVRIERPEVQLDLDATTCPARSGQGSTTSS